ncbi:MAG: hypothetical protein L0Y36_02150 [Planctomycetales bacterium]|nr:hypothetical protein [Planctomycetales bacterium]
MHWKTVILLIAGTLFCLGSAGYGLVRVILRPRPDDGIDESHWELEDRHPALQRYQRWTQITLTAVIISMLLLFLCICV